MILSELAGSGEVSGIIPPGGSPHAFELRPSHARQVQDASALFYVAPHLDGWAAQLPAPHRVEVFALLPESGWLFEQHGDHAHEANPHFWSDPLRVAALVPQLAEALAAANPPESDRYRENAAVFLRTLNALDAELDAQLAPVAGRAVIVMHPSWDYFFQRFHIEVAGVLEPTPGHETSPKALEALIAVAKAEGVRAVLSEPQLPRAPAEALAEAIGVKVFEIDPLGGVPGRDTYAGLIRYNAGILAEALQ